MYMFTCSIRKFMYMFNKEVHVHVHLHVQHVLHVFSLDFPGFPSSSACIFFSGYL